MHAANISGSESMIAVIETYKLFKDAHLFASFELIHLSFASNATQVLQNAAARTRFIVALVEIRRIIAISWLQRLPSQSSL
jgi:hypothetical protein